MPAGALDGIKVVDFGQMVSAPFCAKLFSDYGANVIKVELPGGDGRLDRLIPSTGGE